jgi:hypothetical protein
MSTRIITIRLEKAKDRQETGTLLVDELSEEMKHTPMGIHLEFILGTEELTKRPHKFIRGGGSSQGQ